MSSAQRKEVCRLYRQAIKISRDWYIDVERWRMKAVEIRYQFDMNKHVTDPYKIQKLIDSTKETLEIYRHPDPYICKMLLLFSKSDFVVFDELNNRFVKVPTSPGGSKYERNLPPPEHVSRLEKIEQYSNETLKRHDFMFD